MIILFLIWYNVDDDILKLNSKLISNENFVNCLWWIRIILKFLFWENYKSADLDILFSKKKSFKDLNTYSYCVIKLILSLHVVIICYWNRERMNLIEILSKSVHEKKMITWVPWSVTIDADSSIPCTMAPSHHRNPPWDPPNAPRLKQCVSRGRF